MAVVFRRTPLQRLRAKLGTARYRALDFVFSPVISRLTVDEYYSCRTHMDCLRTIVRNRVRSVHG